jgi:hypothetical protein
MDLTSMQKRLLPKLRCGAVATTADFVRERFASEALNPAPRGLDPGEVALPAETAESVFAEILGFVSLWDKLVAHRIVKEIPAAPSRTGLRRIFFIDTDDDRFAPGHDTELSRHAELLLGPYADKQLLPLPELEAFMGYRLPIFLALRYKTESEWQSIRAILYPIVGTFIVTILVNVLFRFVWMAGPGGASEVRITNIGELTRHGWTSAPADPSIAPAAGARRGEAAVTRSRADSLRTGDRNRGQGPEPVGPRTVSITTGGGGDSAGTAATTE